MAAEVAALSTLGDFVATFNACTSPKEVMKAAQAAGLSPEEAAKLLYDGGEQVSVDLLGTCLGNHAEFCKDLALCYPTNFASFAGMELVPAIRTYLWRFRLPGEAAQIERVIDGFAKAYFAQNPIQDDWDGKRHGCGMDAGSQGWYVRQPRGSTGQACCVHCGVLDDQGRGDVSACQGCGLIHFCQQCRKWASRRGHSVVGKVGYGRACVAARQQAGLFQDDGKITFQASLAGHGVPSTEVANLDPTRWVRRSPIRSQDAVMVLAYAIIMLTTNLHSAKVKPKMAKHAFLQQCREVNDGGNFPGDFLSDIYDDIQREELAVMRP